MKYLFISFYIYSQSYKIFTRSGETKPANFTQLENNDISDLERSIIISELKASISTLTKSGKLSPSSISAAAKPSFIWPVKAADNFDNYGYYGISGFVDHNPEYPDSLLDYNGGTRTYDTENGYNHKGTDIFSWPFSWYKKDNDQVEVIAAAKGIIIKKSDGNYDRNCQLDGEDWNAVYLQHLDGSVGWYGHLKKNSLTNKALYDTVAQGEYLGVVGSSGNSTGPHLHFEVYENNTISKLIDPWEGQYNNSITESWWSNQKPYHDSQILKVSTHNNPPLTNFGCSDQEILNLQDEFEAGDSAYFGIYYRDRIGGQTTEHQIVTSDGIVVDSWEYTFNMSEYWAASYDGFWGVFPDFMPKGDYKFVVSYEGIYYEHKFRIVDSVTSVNNNDINVTQFKLEQNYPNPFNPTTTIKYSIPVVKNNQTTSQHVTLNVFDLLGRKITTLVNEIKSHGTYEEEFDASALTSGLYFYRLEMNGKVQTKKMILMK